MSKKLLDHAALFMFVLMVCVVLSCMGLAEDQGSMLLQTGSLIPFGRTEQDGNLDNGQEEILWQVLSAEDDVLLISRYGLAVRPYDTKGSRGEEYHYPQNILEQSDLYIWMNGEFLSESFTDEERGLLAGDVSLLTCEEAGIYFRSASERKVQLTPYAEAEARTAKQRNYWWLRWTYETYLDVWPASARLNTSDLPAYVSEAGLPSTYYMLWNSSQRTLRELNDRMAVRPVIRITKENLQKLGYSFSDDKQNSLSEKDFYPGAKVVFGQIYNTDTYMNPKDVRYLHDGLDWTVLDVDENGKALLISTYAVGETGAKSFFEGYSYWQWLACKPQEMLNRWQNYRINRHSSELKQEALFYFSEEEKKAIIGEARLLTVDEVSRYFPDRESRDVRYWQSDDIAFGWWVIPQMDDRAAENYCVYYIDSGDPEGSGVTRGTGEIKTLASNDFTVGGKGVRPVIEVDLTVLFPEADFHAIQAVPVEEPEPEQADQPDAQDESTEGSSPIVGKWHMDSASNGAIEPGIDNYMIFDVETVRIVKESGNETVEDNTTGYTIDGDVINVEGGARLKFEINGNVMRMESDYTDAQGNPVVFELSRAGENITEPESDLPSDESPELDESEAPENENPLSENPPAEEQAEAEPEAQDPSETIEQEPALDQNPVPDEDKTEAIEQEPALDQNPVPDEEETEAIEQEPALDQNPVPDEEQPAAAAVPVNPLIDGKLQVPVSSVRADSYITGSNESYPPENMLDGDETTAWQFSTRKSKLKETYVYFSFPEPADIDELWIKNGFWKITAGKDQYTRNSRIKEMGVAFLYADSADYTDKQTIKLKDDKKRKDWQKIELGIHRNVIGVRFRIMSIYKGSKFKNDVCVSEVMFMVSPDSEGRGE